MSLYLFCNYINKTEGGENDVDQVVKMSRVFLKNYIYIF